MKESFEIGSTVRVTFEHGGTRHREPSKFTNRFNKVIEVKDGLYTIDIFNQSVLANLMEKKYAKVEKVLDVPDATSKVDAKPIVKNKQETNNAQL